MLYIMMLRVTKLYQAHTHEKKKTTNKQTN